MSVRPGLVIGSTSHEVKTTKQALEIFGNHLLTPNPIPMPALAAGEVGDPMWSKRQLTGIGQLSQVRVIREGKFEETGRYIHAPLMLLRKGERISSNDLRLYFTERLNEAHGPFQTFSRQYNVKLPQLVGINTIDILLLAFGLRLDIPGELLDTFIERTKRETAEIWRRTQGNVVFLVESPMANILANLTRGAKGLANWLLDAFLKLMQALPHGAKWGFHFCFGRVGDKAMFERLRKVVYSPKYTVDFSNLLFGHLAAHGFTPAFVHYPLRFGHRSPSTSPGDYQEYRRINLPASVQVFGGAIDPCMEFEKQRRIYLTLDQCFGRTVGVASTCGYGSMNRRDMELSLTRMYEVAHSL